MKYYIIAGEASGDLHGSNLIKQIHKKDTNATIQCWGGDLMKKANANVVKHYKDLAFMGFAEVVKNLPTIFKNIAFCKKDISQFNPDVIVLIDYPGFNLRIAEWAKKQGYKIVYYISPQVWAWKANRVKKMKQCIDKMLCIIPFEKDYYASNWNWKVEYVGHPLIEVINEFKETNKNSKLTEVFKPIIAVLPGSRKQEILKKLPIMLSVVKHFPNYEFIVAKAPGLEDDFYKPFLEKYKNVSSVNNKTYLLLSNAVAAMVTSGTATLETALFKIPEVVCYKTSNISYAIGKRLVKIKFISLVNLIMDKPIVKELIQNNLSEKNLMNELSILLNNVEKKSELKENYNKLWEKLEAGGNASEKAANIITEFIK